ncbi:MAG: transporter substrate-binding domain-containing protein [Bacteroidales bacterium]|nr:transporter substrate-binding domain-containing protein [Bacteroidales bacterium]MDD3011928.1 transporter substrate-binding domain-containing protein [Bacteroidales bacterium]MDD3961740.1 transporter substrate-binding domain-containing protein [Bacteroidales bacterium]MDY0285800.1 transporter substrate-binding domain-containing protein [Bacteroidales bacterium]
MVKRNKLLIFILITITVLTIGCNENKKKKSITEKLLLPTQLDLIQQRGKLIATTDYNSTNYFIYRGTPMGYQYELLKAFADHLNVKLEIVIASSLDEAFERVNSGKCDIIAMDMAVTRDRKAVLDFSIPHTKTRQVLIQRKPENWRKMKTWDEVESYLIRDPLELAQETIYIQKNSSFTRRLINLMEEIGDTIYLIEDEQKEMEQLIGAVAAGEIRYSVADEHVALVNSRYFPDIDVRTPVSFSQNLAWAVKKGNHSLLTEINSWFENFNHDLAYTYIYNKYFRNPRHTQRAKSEFFSVTGNKISEYDSIIKMGAERINWDWLLLASLIYQESGFRTDQRSWVGAWGLMQLMPETMEHLGIDSTATAEEQIIAGVNYIASLDKELRKQVPNDYERRKFVMAAYNVGIAHILDAIRLTEKYGGDPEKWDGNVNYYLRKKAEPEFFNDSVVYYGYARGEEPYQYVNEIYDRYSHYRNIIQ